jgi:hypothetical protein
VQFKLAILTVLSTRPDGRATLDELKDEVEALTANAARPSGISSALDDIDIFQSGLVIPDDGGFRITETGRSVLKAFEGPSEASIELPSTSTSHSLKLIDDLIGTEERLKIFDLGIRGPGESPNLETLENEPAVEREAVRPEQDISESQEEPARITAESADIGELANAVETNVPSVVSNAPSFLRRDFDKLETPARPASHPSVQPSSIASNLKRFGGILRGHIEQDAPSVTTRARSGGLSGLVLSVLALLAIIIGAGTWVAVTQIKSLKSELTTLERQLVPLKKQAASSEQPEKKNDSDQRSPPWPAATDKSRPAGESRPPSPPLILSPDEVRLIREYIKPVPSTNPAAQPINVGDPVSIATIPLPSPLVDKVPKLLGARFTIRNGAIIILKRDSHQADAVLGPN